MGNEIRWGILGTARINQAIVQGMNMSPVSRAYAIGSRSLSRAGEVAKELGLPRFFGSYEELLDSREIDAVYIPLPNSLHAEWTIRALESGLPVLCEKPFAADAEEASRMVATATSKGLLLAEAFMYRFHPIYDRIRNTIANGDIGELRTIRSTFSFNLLDRSDIRASAELGGGALLDVGCYCVSFSRLIAGCEPRKVTAFEHRSTVDDTLAGMMEFPNGVLAHFDCSIETPFRSAAEIVGSEGVITLDEFHSPPKNASFVIKRDDAEETVRVQGGNNYAAEVEDFAQALLENGQPRWGGKDAVANMAVLDALRESAETGTPIPVSTGT